jgi:predicted RNase H-like nuclease (RuvC/YqgF family)
MAQAYDVASAVITKINEMTSSEEPEMVEESMSAEAIEGIINGKLSTLTTTFEAVVESLKSISDDNASLRSEIASLKADFESFKAMPSNETKENEKFSRAGNLTAKQQFLKQYKNL